MANDPAKDFAIFLAAEIGSLTYGTNLFSRSLADRPPESSTVPAEAVFVSPLPGVPPVRAMGEKSELRTSILNITIRSAKNSSARALGQQIIDSMDGLAALPASYLDAVPQSGDPSADGQDDKGLFLYGLAVILRWSKVT